MAWYDFVNHRDATGWENAHWNASKTEKKQDFLVFILPPAHRLISPIGLQWHAKTKVNHYLQGSVGKWFGYLLMDGFLDAHSYPHTHPCSGFLTVSSLEDLWTTWRRSSVINARRCRLLRRVLCLVQSSQPSSKNIFRRRAKGEKKNVYTATVWYRNTVFLFCCAHCGSLWQKLPVFWFFGCVCLICTKFPAGESF